MPKVRLFVYGSLKRAGRHHDELKAAVFLGDVRTAPGYALEPVGEYLGLVAAPDGSHGSGAPAARPLAGVPGELFEINQMALAALDAFEGDAYVRAEVQVVRLTAELDEVASFALAYFKKAR